MATSIKLPELVVLPVEGCNDIIYSRENMTSDVAWFRLAIDHDMTLKREHFVLEDDYRRYWFLASGLVEYACAIISGSEGGGKSLCQSYLTYQILRLFPEKRGTLDWSPPKRNIYVTDIGKNVELHDEDDDIINFIKDNDGLSLQELADEYDWSLLDSKRFVQKLQVQGIARLDTVPEFHRCDRLMDEAVVQKLQDEINEVSKYTDDIPEEVLRKLLVYNRVFGLDECDKWGDKGYRTNMTRLIGHLINRRRHYHTSFFMVYIDPKGVDGRYIWDRRTHLITCEKTGYDTCEYRIYHKRANKTFWLILHPSKWWPIWDTHNMSSVSHNIKVDLGASGAKKRKKDGDTVKEGEK